jgi:hypothetical protein
LGTASRSIPQADTSALYSHLERLDLDYLSSKKIQLFQEKILRTDRNDSFQSPSSQHPIVCLDLYWFYCNKRIIGHINKTVSSSKLNSFDALLSGAGWKCPNICFQVNTDFRVGIWLVSSKYYEMAHQKIGLLNPVCLKAKTIYVVDMKWLDRGHFQSIPDEMIFARFHPLS